jgi:hypothetical protein
MGIIKFEYLRINGKESVTFELSPEAYFDLDPGEDVEINSVPLYLQPFQYVDVDVSELVFVKLHIEIGSEKKIFNQTFWNQGKNFLTERIDFGKEPYRELILTVKIDEKTDTYEVLRLFFSKEDIIIPTYHSLILSDQIEQRFDTNVFTEMLKRGEL